MEVQAQVAVSVRIEARAATELPGMTLELVEDFAAGCIDAELRVHHLHRFRIETVIDERRFRYGAIRNEVAQAAKSVLGLKRESPVFGAGVECEFLVGEVGNRHAICQGTRFEWVDPIRHANLLVTRILWNDGVAALAGSARGQPEARRQLLVFFEVTETAAWTKLARR